jgi:hypothetical protein
MIKARTIEDLPVFEADDAIDSGKVAAGLRD